jgi:ubiquitin-conjugating enzyme E2 S
LCDDGFDCTRSNFFVNPALYQHNYTTLTTRSPLHHNVFFCAAGTPYEGGVFKLKLVLNSDFPAVPPKGVFTTTIFHPNVSKAGEICVNTLKRDWRPTYGIAHVLTVIRCLLIVPNPESALNEDAGKLLLDDYDDFARRARLMTRIHATARGVNVGGSGTDANATSASASALLLSTSTSTASPTKAPRGVKSKLASADGGGGGDENDEPANVGGGDDDNAVAEEPVKKKGRTKLAAADGKAKRDRKKKALKRL